MRTDLTPWFRAALGREQLALVHQADPQDALVIGMARHPGGPFSAQIVVGPRGQRRAIAGGSHPTRPELAIARAVEASLEAHR